MGFLLVRTGIILMTGLSLSHLREEIDIAASLPLFSFLKIYFKTRQLCLCVGGRKQGSILMFVKPTPALESQARANVYSAIKSLKLVFLYSAVSCFEG